MSLAWLEGAEREGRLRPLDRHFALQLLALAERVDGTAGLAHPRSSPPAGDGRTALALAAALVSRTTGEGHVCLDLCAAAGRAPFGDSVPGLQAPELEQWREALRASGVVGAPGESAPLVLDSRDRLYLARYWHFEHDLAAALRERASGWAAGVDRVRLAADLRRLFPARDGVLGRADEIDWQAVAAALAVLRRLTVISGGPGTGKTRTVAAVLALLASQAMGGASAGARAGAEAGAGAVGRQPRVALAAPTGKAAARLAESVRRAREDLPLSQTERSALPEEATTLHRLLGARPGRPGFRHDAGSPLHLDLLVVDEASMVDLPLLARTVAALPARARLVLLGDRDQLASVEAGAVLGDVCGRGVHPGYSPELAQTLGEVLGVGAGQLPSSADPGRPAVADALVFLRRSYRFGRDSGIGALAARVNAGDTAGVLALLKAARARDPLEADGLRHRTLEEGERVAQVERLVVPRLRAVLEASGPAEALAALGSFRVLCALREGPWGVAAFNELVERALRRAGLVLRDRDAYRGRPVMVTRNDYATGLFNGDVGVFWPDAGAGGALRVFFPAAGGGLRALLPTRLPAHETVYAMTVHKSQGSELDEVLLVLPDRLSPVLTRELLYTAVTRARASVEIWGPEATVAAAVAARVERTSGLRDALWSDAPPA